MDYRQREEALADFHVFEPGEWRRGQGLFVGTDGDAVPACTERDALAARGRGGPLGLVG
jgi:hypothetical protein